MASNKNRFFILFIFLFFSVAHMMAAPAPKVKYWVKLKDKTGTPFTVSNPSAFLSAKSLARRAVHNISVDQTDLPVNPVYVQQINMLQHVDIVYTSKWLNGVMITIDSNSVAQPALAAIKNFSFVLDTFKVKYYRLLVPPKPDPSFFQAKASGEQEILGNYNYGGSNGQVKQLGVECLHNNGYRGQDMTIAVMDVGFTFVDTNPVFDSLRNEGRIKGTRDFVAGGVNAYQGGTHGTMVLSCMAANKPGTALGTAPKANYWLLRTEDNSSETLTEEYNWIRGAEFADSVGVDMITTSLGYTTFDNPVQNHNYATLNGKTAPMSIAATMAARKGIFVLNAAGNEGQSSWRYISVPGDADSICTVGAVDTLGVLAGFSSVGPTADGRLKPDLVACGLGSWVCEQSVCFPGNGTSFATPVLAGAVACFWQANKNLSNHKILDTLRKTATQANSPNNFKGWGVPYMCAKTNTFVLSGIANLEDEMNHSGILVKCLATSPGGKSDSVFTKENGSYSFNLSPGTYQFKYSKSGYKGVTLSTGNLSSATTLPKVLLLNNESKAFNFNVFCDINSSLISIRLSRSTYQSVQVEIMDLYGRVLFSAPMQSNELVLNLNASILTDGVYLARIKTDEGIITKKFLKK